MDLPGDRPARAQSLSPADEATMLDALTTCRECGAFIDPAKGEESPTGEYTEGTQADPRAPGDWDDLCDRCNYEDHNDDRP